MIVKQRPQIFAAHLTAQVVFVLHDKNAILVGIVKPAMPNEMENVKGFFAQQALKAAQARIFGFGECYQALVDQISKGI